MTYA